LAHVVFEIDHYSIRFWADKTQWRPYVWRR